MQDWLFGEFCRLAPASPPARGFVTDGMQLGANRVLSMTERARKFLASRPSLCPPHTILSQPPTLVQHPTPDGELQPICDLPYLVLSLCGEVYQVCPDSTPHATKLDDSSLLEGPSMQEINSIPSPLAVTTLEAWSSSIARDPQLLTVAGKLAREHMAACQDGNPPSELQSIVCFIMVGLRHGWTTVGTATVTWLMREAVEQAQLDQQRIELAQSGCDFNAHYFQPELHPSNNTPDAKIEDFPHKVKRVVKYMVAQGWLDGSNSAGAVDQIVNRSDLFEAALELHRTLAQSIDGDSNTRLLGQDLARVIAGVVDDQHVPAAYCLMSSIPLVNCLIARGQHEAAVFMRSIGSAIIAMDTRGLSLDCRKLLLHKMRVMFMRMLGSLPLTCRELPARIRGMPSGLVTSLVSMVDSLDAVLDYAANLTPRQDLDFNFRTAGSDCCEQTFAEMRQRHGYKPDQVQLEGGLRNADFWRDMVAKPLSDRGFSIPKKDRSTYYMGHGSESQDNAWNTGDAHEPGSSRLQKYLEKLRKALRQVCRSKPTPIRFFHKHGAGRALGHNDFSARLAAAIPREDSSAPPARPILEHPLQLQHLPAPTDPASPTDPSDTTTLHDSQQDNSSIRLVPHPAATGPTLCAAQAVLPPPCDPNENDTSQARPPCSLSERDGSPSAEITRATITVSAANNANDVLEGTIDFEKLLQAKKLGGNVGGAKLVQWHRNGELVTGSLSQFEREKRPNGKKWSASVFIQDTQAGKKRKLADALNEL